MRLLRLTCKDWFEVVEYVLLDEAGNILLSTNPRVTDYNKFPFDIPGENAWWRWEEVKDAPNPEGA